MIITYFGKQFFKAQVGDTVLAFNPPSKDSKHKGPKFGADVALSTTPLVDYDGVDVMFYGDKKPFTIRGAGEYEVKDILIKGIPTFITHGKEKIPNTVYAVDFDGINMVFVGPLQGDSLPAKLREGIDSPDILFVPIGGENMLDFEEAYKLANELEARVIIPMDYSEGELKKFLKEAGESVKPIDKLTIRKKEIEGKEGEIVILEETS